MHRDAEQARVCVRKPWSDHYAIGKAPAVAIPPYEATGAVGCRLSDDSGLPWEALAVDSRTRVALPSHVLRDLMDLKPV